MAKTLDEINFEEKFGVDFESFRLTGRLPDDEQKDTDLLRYAYSFAQTKNHFPRVYHLGMILRDRLISELEERREKKGFWNKYKVRKLNRQLGEIEDELYKINHLAPGHFVSFEKYEFMQAREEEGNEILKKAVKREMRL